ncbi:MAG: porin [Planctomycetaceae bacterium]|jgi:hypothetical protein|nr:porin [Planctomycetaceae bacterium]
MYKKIIFILLLFNFAVCFDSDFNLSSGCEIVEGDEFFSSPITVPLYTNTIVETDDNNNNNENNKTESENKNQKNKLRPRYNISPNLGNRIELVSAQTAKSLPEPAQIKHAEFNSINNNHKISNPQTSTTPTSAAPTSVPPPFASSLLPATIDSPTVADKWNYNSVVGQNHLYELSVAQNQFAPNIQHNNIPHGEIRHDEIMPLEIPQTPDCNNSTYDNFVAKYTGYFLNANNRRNIRQHNYDNYGFFCNGWLEGGIFLNTHSPDNNENSLIQYNDRDGEFVMNQFYISFGRKLTHRRDWFEFGGQIDLLFGTDYFYTSALGLETRRSRYRADVNTPYPEEADTHWNASHGKRRDNSAALYGLSLPQAYGEIRLPFAWDISVKAGHFYANHGIESATAAGNFFYSHSYNFMFGQPTTLTGVLFTADVPTTYLSLTTSRQLLIFGVTQGWDMFDKQGGLNYIIGTQTISKRNEQNYVSLIAQIGKQSDINSNNRISYTLAINRRLSDRWSDSLEHTFGYEKDGAVKVSEAFNNNTKYGKSCWVSFAKYLKYEINSNLSVGLRAEWFRDDGLARIQKTPMRIGQLFYYTGKNYYEITLGANWRPTRNITIRPELRFDWSDVKLYSDLPNIKLQHGSYNGKDYMTAFAIDAVVRF